MTHQEELKFLREENAQLRVKARALEYIFGQIDESTWDDMVTQGMTPPWPLMHHVLSMNLVLQSKKLK